jgi:hypothetical protein
MQDSITNRYQKHDSGQYGSLVPALFLVEIAFLQLWFQVILKQRFTTRSTRKSMATYECKICGMSVNATCGKCDAPLENNMLKIDENTEVQVSECPNGHGKIKSPLCCGEDMTCSL